ncbi:MAG: hypothetical protein AB7H97_19560 [Pseudobdellovibrionaceae bacterium]
MRSVLFALAFVSAQAVASQCEDEVQTPKPTPRLTFEMIAKTIPSGDNGLGILKLPPKIIQPFYYHVWPKIKARAEEQGRSVYEIVEEYFTLGQLLLEQDLTISELKLTSNLSVSRVHLSFLAELENLGPSAKMRDREWTLVMHTYSAFMSLAVLANILEPYHREFPSFHPLKKLSEHQVMLILDSLENASLDHAAKHIERRREQYAPKRVLEPVRLALKPIVGESMAEELIRFTPTQENQLAVVLKNRMPFVSGRVYKLKDASDEKYTLTLSSEIVKASQEGHFDTVHKLLRGLVGGNRFKSGIKTLFEIGPNIIEVKNVVAGHKRLIGCFEERQIRLLKLETTGDSRASYLKKIPKDLCL